MLAKVRSEVPQPADDFRLVHIRVEVVQSEEGWRLEARDPVEHVHRQARIGYRTLGARDAVHDGPAVQRPTQGLAGLAEYGRGPPFLPSDEVEVGVAGEEMELEVLEHVLHGLSLDRPARALRPQRDGGP